MRFDLRELNDVVEPCARVPDVLLRAIEAIGADVLVDKAMQLSKQLEEVRALLDAQFVVFCLLLL